MAKIHKSEYDGLHPPYDSGMYLPIPYVGGKSVPRTDQPAPGAPLRSDDQAPGGPLRSNDQAPGRKSKKYLRRNQYRVTDGGAGRSTY